MLKPGGQRRDMKTLTSQEHSVIKVNMVRNHKDYLKN